MKQLYTMKELSSGINLGDTTQQTSSIKTRFDIYLQYLLQQYSFYSDYLKMI